jgi:hypothetical protein
LATKTTAAGIEGTAVSGRPDPVVRQPTINGKKQAIKGVGREVIDIRADYTWVRKTVLLGSWLLMVRKHTASTARTAESV